MSVSPTFRNLYKKIYLFLCKDTFWIFFLIVNGIVQIISRAIIQKFHKAYPDPGVPFVILFSVVFLLFLIVCPYLVAWQVRLQLGLPIHWRYPKRSWISPLPVNYPLGIQRFLAWYSFSHASGNLIASFIIGNQTTEAVLLMAISLCAGLIVLVTGRVVRSFPQH